MDAFFIFLAYGSQNIDKKSIMLSSTIVGLYHFFMPILGMCFGSKLNLNNKYIISVIFIVIGINMILDIFKEKEIKPLSLACILLLGLSVSLDSFSIGIGLHYITNHIVLGPIVFAITSLIFTFIGLILGKKINELVGNVAVFFGGLTIIILGVYYIVGM